MNPPLLASDTRPVCPYCGQRCFETTDGLATKSVRGRSDGAGNIVYLVELDSLSTISGRFRRKILEQNPNAASGAPVIYVGLTALTPAERLHNHFSGYKGSRLVRLHGRRLVEIREEVVLGRRMSVAGLRRLVELTTRSLESDEAWEQEAAAILRQEGFTAYSR